MKLYYRLSKPGIVYGNALTALAAFLFASSGHIDIVLLLGMLIGISASIASACVVNNVIDRDIDMHMERTKDRAIPTGRVSIPHALVFALVLAVIGFASLLLFTNLLTFAVTLFGVFVYVGLYTPLKRVTLHSTIVGALAGAVPPVVGYVAVTNRLDSIALALFLVLVCWQMVHFFAIAIFRIDDYAKANIPVMPVRIGIFRTKVAMTVYALLFGFSVYALALAGGLGLIYEVPLGILSLGWILLSLAGFRTGDDARWARRMFFYSLVILLAFCAALALS
ncbi:MAG: cyoE [Parcubacteria group bacterium]|nr:cyoE [Parcubacteria group bacterium]